MKICRNGLHEMTEANTYTTRRYDRGSTPLVRCRACVRAKVARHRESSNGEHESRPSTDTAADFVFLFETGLSPRAIAAKLSMHYPSMLVAIRRAGVRLEYDFREQTWRMP